MVSLCNMEKPFRISRCGYPVNTPHNSRSRAKGVLFGPMAGCSILDRVLHNASMAPVFPELTTV
jgi:hypothetical protein